MKLHDLKPAPGSRKDRMRVGRGIAAGKGKTAGRGTKGQKARAGGSIPAWFEGGQTPLHIRVPKLRGFKRRGRIAYQVVNVGRISAYAEAGRFGVDGSTSGASPVTVNSEVLASAGLVGSDRKPVKILGTGEVATKLFVAADAFTEGARRKIEAAGGFVQLLAPVAHETDAAATTDVDPSDATDASEGSDPTDGTSTAVAGSTDDETTAGTSDQEAASQAELE